MSLQNMCHYRLHWNGWRIGWWMHACKICIMPRNSRDVFVVVLCLAPPPPPAEKIVVRPFVVATTLQGLLLRLPPNDGTRIMARHVWLVRSFVLCRLLVECLPHQPSDTRDRSREEQQQQQQQGTVIVAGPFISVST